MNSNSIGICIGASTVTAVVLENNNELKVAGKIKRNHSGNPRPVLKAILNEVDIESFNYMMLTGRKFRNIINAKSITELEALEAALSFNKKNSTENNNYSAIASLGAENFIIYPFDKQGFIDSVEAGNKCASGTGEFFLQQISRMNITVEQAVKLSLGSQIHRVSGRCSVFCKSDCTHALNKGIPIGNITSGLCEMMSEKILELLEKLDSKRIIAVGGVTNNTRVMQFLRNKTELLTIPDHADAFEALGAAYYALTNRIECRINLKDIFNNGTVSFSFLPPIKEGTGLVKFKNMKMAAAKAGDECIIGLDVGSTTTKAVILRLEDNAMLASSYLRTNGNPVKASRECYMELDKQVKKNIIINGLAVTGSGRKIAGLHADTNHIINEIIAHATGAAFFDKEVDTIFEIGGQDAKYTYLTNSVPSDYAMNEACSAGTGSFLEEAAKESLQVGYKEIQDAAFRGKHPPNFNDQCAAFINSDIKTATHEGINKEDIISGLVYSVCMNYINRVKGQRPVGNKIFMQGGVCYNKAVPIAMANLLEKQIIVPPEPGLIGAFGVAMELKNRISGGLAGKKQFNLKDLFNRQIEYGKSFVCRGEKCDRGCKINMLIIGDKKLPFGGVCDKYYNLVHHIKNQSGKFDYVKLRQRELFNDYHTNQELSNRKIGFNRSYLIHTLFPLYYHFFNEIGLDVVLPDKIDPEGVKKKYSSFCYPGEIAHGCYAELLKKDPDYIFLPKVFGLHVKNSNNAAKEHQSTCVLLQSEAYYLSSAFKTIENKNNLISPVLDFTHGFKSQAKVFIDMAAGMGCSREKAKKAYDYAVKKQEAFFDGQKRRGIKLLNEIEKDPDSFAIVLFGRSYNAFAKEANMGIPAKFSSRGIRIIPWDSLPFEQEHCHKDMCWAIGQELLKASAFVKKHRQLFAVYITNFSCGPDSFLVGYFRDIMKTKPSLTLELDSHTADAGINTRIEAFLDIVKRYRGLRIKDKGNGSFILSEVIFKNNQPYFISSDKTEYSFYDKRVHVLIPSMGALSSSILAACFRGIGIRASAVPVYDFTALKQGRANASGKECLPLLLTSGGLLKYLNNGRQKDEMVAYFMPFTPGNCRFSQYSVFIKNLLSRRKIKNVTIFTLVNAEESYNVNAFTPSVRITVLKAFIIADVMEDIKNSLAVLALNKEEAMGIFEAEWKKLVNIVNTNNMRLMYKELEKTAGILSEIPLRYTLKDAKKVSIMGEIFVRRDYFSCRELSEKLISKDIIIKKAHFFEWLKYVDYLVLNGFYEPAFDLGGKIKFYIKNILQNKFERRIKKILAKSGLFEYEIINIKRVLDYGRHFFDFKFRGESILALGNFFKDILHSVHGVISVGPFACMPARVIESILSVESNYKKKVTLDNYNNHKTRVFEDIISLPFLSIEADGNPFPQIIDARIEAFCVQVERLHKKVKQQCVIN